MGLYTSTEVKDQTGYFLIRTSKTGLCSQVW